MGLPFLAALGVDFEAADAAFSAGTVEDADTLEAGEGLALHFLALRPNAIPLTLARMRIDETIRIVSMSVCMERPGLVQVD